jgi:hypothetical protein
MKPIHQQVFSKNPQTRMEILFTKNSDLIGHRLLLQFFCPFMISAEKKGIKKKAFSVFSTKCWSLLV